MVENANTHVVLVFEYFSCVLCPDGDDLADSVFPSATSTQYVCANVKGHSVHLRQDKKLTAIQNAFLN